jgi:hypothetical protein
MLIAETAERKRPLFEKSGANSARAREGFFL